MTTASEGISDGISNEWEDILPPVTVESVSLRYERHPGLPHPRHAIRFSRAPTPAAAKALIDYSQRVLDRDESYCCLWDLRSCGVPPATLLWRGMRWAFSQKEGLDANLTCVAILLNGGPIRSTVKFVLGLTRPVMPTRSFDNELAAFEFVSMGRLADLADVRSTGNGLPQRYRLSQLSWLSDTDGEHGVKSGQARRRWASCYCCCGSPAVETDLPAEATHEQSLLHA